MNTRHSPSRLAVRLVATALVAMTLGAACSSDKDSPSTGRTTTTVKDAGQSTDKGATKTTDKGATTTAAGATKDSAGTPAAAGPFDNAVDAAKSRTNLSSFVKVVEAAGLTDELSKGDPLTIFAPNNSAFDAYAKQVGKSFDDLLAEGDKLAPLVRNHMVAEPKSGSALMGMPGGKLETLAGGQLTIKVDGAALSVNDASLVTRNLQAGDSIVHTIGAVLAPPA